MANHELKTDSDVFFQSMMGSKPFEVRFNDRNYQVGDYLFLKETKYSAAEMKQGRPLEYTGRVLSRSVTCVVEGYGLSDGFVALGVKNV